MPIIVNPKTSFQDTKLCIDYNDVEKATERLAGVLAVTPTFTCDFMNKVCQVYV